MLCDLSNTYSTTKANKEWATHTHITGVWLHKVLRCLPEAWPGLCSLPPVPTPPLDEEGSWGFSLTPGKTMATLFGFALATSLPASDIIRRLHIDEVMQEVTEALPVVKCLSLI